MPCFVVVRGNRRARGVARDAGRAHRTTLPWLRPMTAPDAAKPPQRSRRTLPRKIRWILTTLRKGPSFLSRSKHSLRNVGHHDFVIAQRPSRDATHVLSTVLRVTLHATTPTAGASSADGERVLRG